MDKFEKLTAKNFQAYALENYDDPQCEDIEEFHEDLRRFRYFKRLLHRYHEDGEMRERLMLNHLTCIFNVFGFEASMRMLRFKVKEDRYWPSIRTMLIYLGYIKEDWMTEVGIDNKLVDRLREL